MPQKFYEKNLVRHHKEVQKEKFELIFILIHLSEMHQVGRVNQVFVII